MKTSDRRRSGKWTALITPLAFVLGTALVAFILSLFSFLEALENKIYDFNFQFRGPRSVDSTRIAIVAIDQNTADSLPFPFDRRHYATLVTKLKKLGASRVAFDIDFSSRGYCPESDSIFKAAIAEAGNVVLQGKTTSIFQKGLKHPVVSLSVTVPEVAPPGTPFGLINDLVDGDGVIRRYPLFFPARDTSYLSMALKLYSIEKGVSGGKWEATRRGDFVYAGLDIPRIEANLILLDFYGPAGTFPTYSFIDIITGVYDFAEMFAAMSEEDKQALVASGMADLIKESPFKDKIVLVGASDDELQDNKFTPFYSSKYLRKTPGVEVHANALQALFDGRFVRPIGFWWIIAGVLLLALSQYLSNRYLPHWLGLIAAAGLLVVILLSGVLLFAKLGLWLREAPLLLAVVVAYPTNLVYRFILMQREKAMIRGMFGMYVPQKVVDALIANPELAKLGGERRRMSVLFTDVAGFSTFSEKMEPEALVHLLNEYLTELGQIIVDYDGIIDKYAGDNIMAEFGAPLWFPDHAARICRASIGMQKRLAELRLKWRSEGKPELYSRVGVNTGDMIIGNMGSLQKFDYTVMGDSVNLASRLEGANKVYGSTIMIGKNTYDDVKDLFVTRPLDFLQVKGKTEPVEVFELLAEKWEELTPEKQKCVELYRQAMIKFRTRQFREAGELFGQAEEADPTDGPSKTYHERAAMYFLEPPPPDWDMVWELHEK